MTLCIEKGGDPTGASENYGVSLLPDISLEFVCKGNGWGAVGPMDSNWHHCAVVARNGDASPVIYIDGVQKPITYRYGRSSINLYPSTRPLHIGAQVDPVTGWNYYSQTFLDELSIYDRALSAAEILAIYNAGSAGKRLTVSIANQPASQQGYWGKSVTFEVTAAGNPPLSYQWQQAGAAISGATNSSLTLTNLQMTDAGSYAVIVTDAYGSITSNPAILTINPAGASAHPAASALLTVHGRDLHAADAPDFVTYTCPESGVYEIRASGTWQYWLPDFPTYWADAGWATFDSWATIRPKLDGSDPKVAPNGVLMLWFNDGVTDFHEWGEYSPAHQYSITKDLSLGQQLTFWVSDWYPYKNNQTYSDNAGSLNVEIIRVPER
jgi:hypothetical protein